MSENAFQQFRRSQIAELRPIEDEDDHLISIGTISISQPDRENGSPKLGDMIARNPVNHDDLWLVAADYFAANFEPLASDTGPVKSEETSSRVASIAGRIMNMTAEETTDPDLLTAAKTLAGSALTQVADKPLDFRGRLVQKRDDLDARLIKLNAYLADGAADASPRHREMLREQSKHMSDLLTVLDERIADLHIDDRSSTAGEISDGE